MITKYQATIFIISVMFCAELFSQRVTELVNPLKVTEGVWNTFLVSDLFFAQKYDVEILSGKEYETQYDRNTNELKIKTTASFDKLAVLRLLNNGSKYDLLLRSDKKKNVRFELAMQKAAKRVNIFGSFNGWNRESLSMQKNKEATYEIELMLAPGNYEYKFLVDGEEILDPINAQQVPNGLGGINSLITVSSDDGENIYLHQNGFVVEKEKLVLKFLVESQSSIDHAKGKYYVLIDNELINLEHAQRGNEITFQFELSEILAKDFIRILVQTDKAVSNLQTIFLEKGIPVKNNSGKFWHGNILYSLLIDRFKDGDKTNSVKVEHPEIFPQANYYGGDLAGLYQKLTEGYFDSLAVSTLWISPVIENTNLAYQEYPEPHRYYSGYHGYWPTEPRSVEEKFGTMELLQKFINEAHKRKIKVLLDFVAHHVHSEHPYWQNHKDWFGSLELPDGRRNLRLWDEHRLTTWFEPFMPSFDFAKSSDALEQLTNDAIWWLKTSGADGFRHDAVKHVPNEFWRLLTKKINNEFPEQNVYQIGETFGSYELVSSYVNNGQLNAQFNFLLYDAALVTFADSNASFTMLDEQLKKSFDVYGVNNLMGNIIDSHDKVRFMSYADGDITLTTGDAIEIGWNNPPVVNYPQSYDKQKLALAYLLTIPGLPVIYYGDEIGLTGAADPDNRRMMQFDNQLDDLQKSTLEVVRKLSSVRKNSSALLYGDFYTLHSSKNIYAFIRSDMNEKVIVVLNKGIEHENISLTIPAVSDEEFIDLLNGETITAKDGKVDVTIGAINYRILKLKHK